MGLRTVYCSIFPAAIWVGAGLQDLGQLQPSLPPPPSPSDCARLYAAFVDLKPLQDPIP